MNKKNKVHKNNLIKNLCEIEDALSKFNTKCASKTGEKYLEKKMKSKNK